MGTCICQRPKDAKSRKTFGRWSLDRMVFCRGVSKVVYIFFGTDLCRRTILIGIFNRGF